MKPIRKFLLLVLLACAVCVYIHQRSVYAAQSSIGAASGAFTISSVAGTTVANCPAVAASTSRLCVVSTGVFISTFGGSYVQAMGGPSGVVSWNGLVGAVTYVPPPAPVSSVNGKVGAVVLGATTNLN